MKKVLIVEDDQFIRDMVASKLTQHGFVVDEVGSGNEGYKHVEEAAPDVMLLDLDLPDMRGSEFLEYIRKNEQLARTPVIVFSNDDDGETQARINELGVSGYYIKVETNLDELIKKIGEIVNL